MTPRGLIGWLTALTGVVVWAYWPTLDAAADRWATDPQYSHGYLIPLFSIYLLWSRRKMIAGASLEPNLWGFALLAVGLALKWAETLLFLNGLDALSLVPTLAGAVLIVGGWPALKWAWPAVGFLVFMVPLPYRLQTAMSGKLQAIATAASTFLLQLFGTPAVAEGNVISLDEVKIGVVEACSGLGMVVTFAALSAAVALMVRSALWVRLTLLAGAIPVAIAANIVRITGTGLLYYMGMGEAANKVFHDLAGWLMMPLGVGFILVELFILERLVIDRGDPRIDHAAPLTLSVR